ncbi:MAG TPA: hypothetical protein DDZ88_22670 [Verrucomicrobiales bacterium]|nr:hypothetical protein [Verrucomicrobiales bacterium]
MDVIINYIEMNGDRHSGIRNLDVLPRIGETFCRGDRLSWWRVTDVIHTDLQHDPNLPVLVVERTEPLGAITLMKSELK